MRKLLLDTNAYSNFLRGDHGVLDIISKADKVYMSIFVLGELLAGFKGGSKEKRNIETLNNFLSKPTVEIVNATIETSDYFATVKNMLKNNATPIPINDVWIAAHTLETGSVLVTFDEHFSYVSGLRIAD